jgi:hypothetical protein
MQNFVKAGDLASGANFALVTVAGQRRIYTGFAITISAVSSADTLPHQRC